MERQIYVYYDEAGTIISYAAREDENYQFHSFILVPLTEMRKFYDGEATHSYCVVDFKIVKKEDSIYDESYINENFFEITDINESADFRIVAINSLITIINDVTSIGGEDIILCFTRKDDPSILLKTVRFNKHVETFKLIVDFSVFAMNNDSFTYSLEIFND